MQAENKTQPTLKSVPEFIESIPEEGKRKDSQTLVATMRSITGEEPVLWGDAIIGFGLYHYVYATGREGDMPKVGFSPRKQALTLYLSYGFENYQDLMSKLGKYKIGKICLYLKHLSDVDMDVLKELVLRSYQSYDHL
jgi:hypothetical protein